MSVRGAIVNGFHATIPGRRLHRDNRAVRRRDGLVDVDFTRSRSTTIGLPIKRRFKGESSNEYALFYFPVPFASPRVPSLKGRRPDDLNQRQLLPSGRQELHLHRCELLTLPVCVSTHSILDVDKRLLERAPGFDKAHWQTWLTAPGVPKSLAITAPSPIGHKSLDYDETHLRSRLRSYVLSVFFSLEPVHFR